MSILYQFVLLLFTILIFCIAITQVTKRTTIEGLTAECNNTKGKYENVQKKINELQNRLKFGPLTKQLNEIRSKVSQSTTLVNNIKRQAKKCQKKKRDKDKDKDKD